MLIKKRVKYKKWMLPSLGGEGWGEIDIASCKEFSLEEIELQELRFEFMKRSSYTRWNEKVKKDFDNVARSSRAGLHDMKFPEWWQRHNLHFSVAHYGGFIEIENDDDYDYFSKQEDASKYNTKIFVLFMDTPVNAAKREIAEILKAHRAKTKRQTTRYDSNGYYPLHGWEENRYLPDRQMLWNMLDVYDLKMHYTEQGIRRFGWQIEEEISNRRLAAGQLPLISRSDRVRKETADQKRGKAEPEIYAWDELTDERRRVQASTISRYFKQAKAVIANVEQGVFPKLEVDK